MENKIISRFKMIGLSKPKSFTLSNIGKEDIFWASTKMPQNVFDIFFESAETEDDFWKRQWEADVEHEGLYPDGTPVNPTVTCIVEISTLKIYTQLDGK